MKACFDLHVRDLLIYADRSSFIKLEKCSGKCTWKTTTEVNDAVAKVLFHFLLLLPHRRERETSQILTLGHFSVIETEQLVI